METTAQVQPVENSPPASDDGLADEAIGRTLSASGLNASSTEERAAVEAIVVKRWKTAARRDRFQRAFVPLGTTLLLGLLWEWWSESANSIMIPGSAETMVALWESVQGTELWAAAATTGQALVIGYLIATVAGVAIGIAVAQSRRFERVADVYINILLVTPMAALIPVLIMATGLTLTTRVIVVVAFCVPMVVVNARAGIKGVDPNLIQMARCFGAGRRQVWKSVTIPGAAPGIVTGLRLGLARSITGTLVIELLLIPVGLGGLILNYRGTFQAAELYAVVIFVVLVSLVLLNVLKVAEKALFGWAAVMAGDHE